MQNNLQLITQLTFLFFLLFLRKKWQQFNSLAKYMQIKRAKENKKHKTWPENKRNDLLDAKKTTTEQFQWFLFISGLTPLIVRAQCITCFLWLCLPTYLVSVVSFSIPSSCVCCCSFPSWLLASAQVDSSRWRMMMGYIAVLGARGLMFVESSYFRGSFSW